MTEYSRKNYPLMYGVDLTHLQETIALAKIIKHHMLIKRHLRSVGWSNYGKIYEALNKAQSARLQMEMQTETAMRLFKEEVARQKQQHDDDFAAAKKAVETAKEVVT
jgi:predicted HD phosphohydrolase